MAGVSESISVTTVEINNINIARTCERSRKPAQDVSAVLQGKGERRSIRSERSQPDSKQEAATAGLWGDLGQLKALRCLNYGSKISPLILTCLHSVCRSAGELGKVTATSLNEQLVVVIRHHPPPFMSLLFQYGVITANAHRCFSIFECFKSGVNQSLEVGSGDGFG